MLERMWMAVIGLWAAYESAAMDALTIIGHQADAIFIIYM